LQRLKGETRKFHMVRRWEAAYPAAGRARIVIKSVIKRMLSGMGDMKNGIVSL